MPKEWGTDVPNISKFVKAVPTTAQELLANLQKLGENWSYVNKCGVFKPQKAIMVDLNGAANFAGNKDFYIPLKTIEVEKADTLVKALVAKVESSRPIIEQDAIALFATVETAR